VTFAADNAYDVGGVNRVRNIFVAGYIDTTVLQPTGNVVEQRNGTNSQAFRVYNTYTDPNNWERGYFRWQFGIFETGTEYNGSGQPHAYRLVANGNANIIFNNNFADRWFIDGLSGCFLAWNDNLLDIGASGANRPRNIFAAGVIQAPVLQISNVNLLGGSSAPAAGLGADGDFFFRKDTPGVAGQRIYVKSSGAWTGVDGVDKPLRQYIQTVMAVLDPNGPPPPPA